MDGDFVPNITIGPAVVKALRPHSAKPFDVHLMIAPVDPFVEDFADAGADIISFHPEAGPHPHRTVQLIKSLGKQAGIVLNPHTPAKMLDDPDRGYRPCAGDERQSGLWWAKLHYKPAAQDRGDPENDRQDRWISVWKLTAASRLKPRRLRFRQGPTRLSPEPRPSGGPGAYAANIAALRG